MDDPEITSSAPSTSRVGPAPTRSAAEGPDVDDGAEDVAFTNARTGASVVLAFVPVAGFWRVYRRDDGGALVNWPVTAGRAFGDELAAREFLGWKGWRPGPPHGPGT